MTTQPLGARAEETSRYFKKKKHIHAHKRRSLQGLEVSSLGFGTYLGGYDDPTDAQYEKALEIALLSGCNFIDTALNYRCQKSEKLIGRVLNRLISRKEIQRSEVVIGTKGGFIPFEGQPPVSLSDYVAKKWVEPGILKNDDIVSSSHSLAVSFIQQSINQSLANMGLSTLDFYYLHNPEVELVVFGPERFYERMEKAFALLEENVAQGKIQYYGVATWKGLREPAEITGFLSLDRLMDLAKKVGGEGHHFKVIQLPYNLAMLEAVSIHNHSPEGRKMPVLSAAHFHGLSVMISAPLLQGQMASLSATLAQKIPGDFTMAQKALQFVLSTPLITTAFTGMKQEEHVRENLKLLQSPSWDLQTLQSICGLVIPSV